MFSFNCGKCFSIRFTKAGQQDVVVFLPSLMLATTSSASLQATTSAPRATSRQSLKPRALIASFNWGTVTSPNWPSIAGAIIAYTLSLVLIELITLVIIDASPIAPKGQATTHWPQLMHFASSIIAKSFSSIWTASTGQVTLQGLSISTIAWYGQALRHWPHFLHLDLSMYAPWGVFVIAPNLQALIHFCARQLWQLLVTVNLSIGQPSQAACITWTIWVLSDFS